MIEDNSLQKILTHLMSELEVEDVLKITFYTVQKELTGYERGSMDFLEAMVETTLYYLEHNDVPAQARKVG